MNTTGLRGGGLLLLAAIAASSAAPVHAAIVSRNVLKTFFESGDVPTQQQFSNLLDSYIHQTDDGLTLVGMGVSRDGTPGGRFLRIGANVGINETMPDAHQAYWRKAPAPNIPPIPGMCPSFCGSSGFLPLEYESAAGEAHYGFLQITMAADETHPVDSAGTGSAGAQSAPLGPAIFVAHWVWESTPGATLTTFVVPEPAGAALVLLLGLPYAVRRRRGNVGRLRQRHPPMRNV